MPVAIAGCDVTGQYQARFQQALQQSAARAVFDVNLHFATTDITDAARKSTGAKLRIPKVFDGSSKSLPATDASAKPPFLNLPGLSYAIERQLDDNAGQFLPAYIYFAAVPKSEQKADALQASIAQQVAAALPGAAWGDAPLRTPTGQTISVRRLRVDGKQDFADVQKKVVKTDGRFDLYLLDGGDNHILVGWRTPKGQSDKYQLETATEAAMGTIELPAGAQPAAAT